MQPLITYLVDENEEQRRAFKLVLNELFHGTGVVVEEFAPLPAKEDYVPLLASGKVAALILDQKMEDGGMPYSGTQLSEFLRAIAPKLPIYILSNYTYDTALFEEGESDVEQIVSKDDLKDPTTRPAQIFKARFLRRLGGFTDVLDTRAERYHELLVKSLGASLTPDELKEMGLLETERIIPQQAKELRDVADLNAAIEELRKQMKKP